MQRLAPPLRAMEAKDADFPPEVRTALRLDAAALFASGREVVIAHAGEFYRLRLTRQNRLILTK